MRCLVAAVVLAAGCGDNIPWLPLDARARAQIEAECAHLIRCGLLADTERCHSYFRIIPDLSFDAALAAGKIEYDGTRAHECHLALRGRSCDSTAAENRIGIASCDMVFTGAVEPGSACTFDGECVTGKCNQHPCPEGACCEGLCSASGKLTAGAACTSTTRCAADLFCAADGICTKRRSLEIECSSDFECDAGLGCVGGRPGRCRRLPAMSESCPFARCSDVGARCDTSGRCVPIGLPGDSCSTNDDCSIYIECDSKAAECVYGPALGERCTRGCAGNSWCRFNLGEDSGFCVAPLPSGAMCTAGNQCASFSCPDSVATCAPQVRCI